ncbi:hypothetical protein [Spirillospora albida]|uniref:hypothetical protein n=1 Tax=Spirillospora albida TaxID=58123 RepID=UPI00068BA4AE|nr:hypothetical protein [Spirillospora albida]
MSRRAGLLQDRPVPSWARTRRRRRAVVAAGGAAVAMPWAATVVCWHLAPSDTAMVATFVLLGVATALAFPVISLLNAATRGATSLQEHELDERQVAERLRAHTAAHRTMLALLAGLVFAVLAVPGDRGTEVPIAAITVGVVALFLTHLSLPLLVAGWRMQDPPPDDEDGV